MSRKHHGPLKLRDIAPSKGERRFKYKHKGHKPSNVLPFRARAVKVVRMFNSLQENGWSFVFKVHAMSPRGWPYEGEGATAEEAFLKAFGAWEQDVADLIPKVPSIVSAAIVKAEPMTGANLEPTAKLEPPKRMYKKTRIKELILACGPEVLRLRGPGPRVPLPDDLKVKEEREWRRLYMRQYRAQKQFERQVVNA
jgi:hypothetical protein